ncbi:thiamine pyrophosphate-binding protein [Fredinandcohnia sp. 179-A 10B2 NHS]|uniref:thiamine pyrophosphate-binding protein n=1 Tax=Fredinandcohnia sp. 179-A 10B2 NHS TaxID=3235176 RepID=UPI0039A29248
MKELTVMENMQQSSKTVASILLEQLNLWGVKRIYGVVGDAIIDLMDELAKQETIQFIAVKHESVAAMMASAEAKLTGRIGVCLATMGPGLGNLINGLGDAYMDKTPVLAITGQAPTKKIGTDYKQYIDQQELIKPIAEYTTLLAHPNSITDVLVKAMNTSEAKGAVSHLSIPKDMFALATSANPKNRTDILEGSAPFQFKDGSRAITIMKSAKKPMILAGLGAMNAVVQIKELASKWGAGILVSLGAKGYFDDSYELLLGGIGQGGNPYAKDLFKQSDVVLLVGNSWWPEGYVPENAQVIQIDAVKENIAKGIPVELGIYSKAESTIPLLIEGLQDHTKNESWVTQLHEVKRKWDVENEQEGLQTTQPIHPSRIVRSIENHVEKNAIIALDTGDITVWFNRNFRSKGQSILFSGEWRTMGYGLPAALSAKLCFPEQQVVAIVGDGGIEMTLADLLTAVRYQIDIKVIVFNNHALQMEKDKMVVSGNQPYGTDLTNPDFAMIAKGCSWKGYTVKSEDELDETIKTALSHKGPTLIAIETAPVVHPETK